MDVWWSIKACAYSTKSALFLQLFHHILQVIFVIQNSPSFSLGHRLLWRLRLCYNYAMNIRGVIGVAIAVGITILIGLPVVAESYGGGSVQGYASETPLDNGTIVQLAAKESKKVKIATKKELTNMFGVTVDRSQLPVTLSSGDAENEVFVAVSGTYNVLVSTEGGEIKSGDYVTLSSVNGVAMKASTKEETVFGRANATFDGRGLTLGQTTLKDSTGKDNQTVKLGTIPVTINIQRNPTIQSTEANLPDMLRRVGQAIAEKEVSPVRIYLSMGIALISLIAAIAVLYAGVRSGVISIGRNPMGKKSIFRALLQVILTSVLILVIGLFAVYLLLKL